MRKIAKVDAVSYKKGGKVLVVNNWIKITRDVDLTNLRVGHEHTFEVVRNFDEEWVITKIIDPIPYIKQDKNHEDSIL